ncbi:MAG: tetratricopeptide repeat protein [Bacteroidales bacterium]|nr:tetratricopeptide repeat protein [Bacteroidales bacterium]
MRTINVFLASSDELKDERIEFGNLIRQLDDIFLKERGIHIKLLVWEDMDPCYNNCRKQDEYNAWIRDSQIFVALFYTHAGQYTLEEFEVAKTESLRRKEPKLFICCREPKNDEVEEKDLTAFKQELEKKLGHFPLKYTTTDKLHHDFTMFFLRLTMGSLDALKIENGKVMLSSFIVANMDNLPFASGNVSYQEIKQDICKKTADLEMLRAAMQQSPGLEGLYQNTIKELNAKKEMYAQLQQALLATAKRVSEMQMENVGSELRRAVEAFESGHIEAANAILDGIELEAKRHEVQLDTNRELVHQDIEAFLLQAKTIMADAKIPIETRIERVTAKYADADRLAEKSAWNSEKYADLLCDYAIFMYDYAFYEEALEIIQRQMALTTDKVKSYNIKGKILFRLDRYQDALEIFKEALRLLKENDSADQYMIGYTYNNIGQVLIRIGEYENAMEQAENALKTNETEGEGESSNFAKSYENIANGLLWSQGREEEALEIFNKTLEIESRIYGEESKEVAVVHRHIGDVYRCKSDDNKALDHYKTALSIFEKTLGERNPETGLTYGCIGVSYMNRHRYKEALENTLKGLKIREETLGADNTNMAESYYWLGEIYSKMSELQNYETALNYYSKAKDIRIRKYGLSHHDTLAVEYAIARVFIKQGEKAKAVEYFSDFVEALEKEKTGEKTLVLAYYYLGVIYGSVGEYDKSIYSLEVSLKLSKTEDYIRGYIHLYIASIFKLKGDYSSLINHTVNALSILEKIKGKEDNDVAYLRFQIGEIYEKMSDYDHAIEYYKLILQDGFNDTEDFSTAGIYYHLGMVYYSIENYPQAIDYYNKALEWVNKHEINDVSIAIILFYIGLTYFNQKSYPEALECMLKAEKAEEETCIIDSIYFIIANIYNIQNDLIHAQEYYIKSLQHKEKMLGTTHPDVVNLYRTIGLLYCTMEKYPESMEYLEKLLKSYKDYESGSELDDSTILLYIDAIGTIYYNNGDYRNALYYYYKCMEIREKMYGVDDIETAGTYVNYGASCCMNGSYITALEYFNKAKEVFHEKLGATAPETQNAQKWIEIITPLIRNN